MNYVITKEQLEKLGNYLATKPWMEVHQLLQLLGTLPPLAEPMKNDEKVE